MFKTVILAIVLMAPIDWAEAQEADAEERDRQYVTDQLRLSLYAKPDSSSKVLQYLSSGDLLLIEQLSGPYALVTAPDQTEGWVKRGFLVSSPTSNLLLRDEQVKVENLEVEITRLSNSKVVIDQYEKDMNELVLKMEALENESQQASDSFAQLQLEMSEREYELERELALKSESKLPTWVILWEIFLIYWQTIVPIILGIILLSFLISKVIVEARIKSKFHGIKIW
jgi:uncharacterized protein YgiM (DUF1202 family)